LRRDVFLQCPWWAPYGLLKLLQLPLPLRTLLSKFHILCEAYAAAHRCGACAGMPLPKWLVCSSSGSSEHAAKCCDDLLCLHPK
jgi:hypothetical protein